MKNLTLNDSLKSLKYYKTIPFEGKRFKHRILWKYLFWFFLMIWFFLSAWKTGAILYYVATFVTCIRLVSLINLLCRYRQAKKRSRSIMDSILLVKERFQPLTYFIPIHAVKDIKPDVMKYRVSILDEPEWADHYFLFRFGSNAIVPVNKCNMTENEESQEYICRVWACPVELLFEMEVLYHAEILGV